MNIVYLPSTVNDLVWFRQYYDQNFPAGRAKAKKQFFSVEKLLCDNPYIGHKIHSKNVRELSIPNTPFSFIYRVNTIQIEIIRIWDERQSRCD